MSILISLVAMLMVCLVRAQDGWKMTNRFHGFRYEINSDSSNFASTIKEYADNKKCFGWVQMPRPQVFVGEVRCSKNVGQDFQNWFENQKGEQSLLVYEDTKIRLHFTYFKILDKSRDTCFIDAPHKCTNVADASGTDEL
jgi:hypothetical protein